jgi:hypothetical protein
MHERISARLIEIQILHTDDVALRREIDLDRINRRGRSKKRMRMILKRLADRSRTR